MNKKCMIAMSGGVDSSVAVSLMREKGYDCIGCTLRLCPGAPQSELEDAKAVAEKLGISHIAPDCENEFRACVMDGFAKAYAEGKTPNPCIACNRFLKFQKLSELAEKYGCDTIVSGHYARAAYHAETGRYELKKAADEEKDQSYVLYSLTQEQLARLYLPLGEMTKAQVRELAAKQGFSNAGKPDSQDICFVPDGDYAAFLHRHTGKTFPAGDFVDTQGNVLGKHKGIVHYTVGQRKGLGIAWEHPLYVLKIDAGSNTVTLGRDEELYTRELWAENVNFVSLAPCEGELRCKAKIRYRHKEQPCIAEFTGGQLHIVFDEPQRAATPGQSVVLYDGDRVLAGGIIK